MACSSYAVLDVFKDDWRLSRATERSTAFHSLRMNPVGIHFSYWTQEWSSEPIQFVKKAQKCGFDILEVNAPKITRMSKAERDALKGAANDADLGLTYSIGMTADMDLVSEDPATRKKGISFLQDLSKAMKSMGGTIMAGINYSSWPRKLLPGQDKEVLTERAVQGVKEAIKTAEDCDVVYCGGGRESFRALYDEHCRRRHFICQASRKPQL
jgi:D-psicose/D-tagatose/L-ribulose 3-epimerase